MNEDTLVHLEGKETINHHIEHGIRIIRIYGLQM